METSRYFCVVLGAPHQTGRNRIEDGWYQPVRHAYTSYPESGDVLLFYCTEGYPGYQKQLPGIGIALGWTGEREQLHYKYLPFTAPINREEVIGALTPDEQRTLRALHIWQHWLFEVSPESAVHILTDRETFLFLDGLSLIRPVRPSLDFPVHHTFGSWPSEETFRREEMYGEWGR